jgi:tetratricopeptide (TPR) repeat protein
MKALFSSKLTMGSMAILLATGQVGGCSDRQETRNETRPTATEITTQLRGIPLSCYVQVGPKGIHPSITSSTVELENFQSAQWAEIALEYAKVGDFPQAIALTEKIGDDLQKNETLVEIAGQLAAAGNYDKAKQLVANIKAYETYKAKGLARIGRFAAIAGNNQVANLMFSEAIAFAKTLDAELIQPMALAEIAIAYAAAGKEAEAMQLVAEIQDENSKAMALAGIAAAWAEAQQLSKALQVIQMIADDYYKAQALSDIAKKVTVAELPPIVQNINTITDQTNKDAALAEIVMLYIRSGQFDQAAELTKTFLGNDWLLPGIIAEYAKTGQMNSITTLTNSMENEYWQNRALIEMVSGYAAIGDFAKALELANGIYSADTKSSALMAIAQALAARKNYPQALELLENIAASTDNEAIDYDIESYFAPLVLCALEQSS